MWTMRAESAVFVNNITINSQQDAVSVQVGAQYRVGPGRILASVARQNDRMPSDSDATLFALGYNYFLSKRTDLYAVAAYQHANGTQRLSDGTTQAAQASIGSYGYNGTSTQEIAIVGIRHKF